MDSELEKFASYPDPLDRIEKALEQKSFDKLLPERMHPFIDEKVNKDFYCFRLAESHKAKDSSRVKRIYSNHTWSKLLITHIEKDSIELWLYEWEEEKKLKNESILYEESDIAIKIVEQQFPFLSYQNSNNGFNIFNRIQPQHVQS
ncbi:5665_t:CDS:2, partial [Gigaspora margarita]